MYSLLRQSKFFISLKLKCNVFHVSNFWRLILQTQQFPEKWNRVKIIVNFKN